MDKCSEVMIELPITKLQSSQSREIRLKVNDIKCREIQITIRELNKSTQELLKLKYNSIIRYEKDF